MHLSVRLVPEPMHSNKWIHEVQGIPELVDLSGLYTTDFFSLFLGLSFLKTMQTTVPRSKGQSRAGLPLILFIPCV